MCEKILTLPRNLCSRPSAANAASKPAARRAAPMPPPLPDTQFFLPRHPTPHQFSATHRTTPRPIFRPHTRKTPFGKADGRLQPEAYWMCTLRIAAGRPTKSKWRFSPHAQKASRQKNLADHVSKVLFSWCRRGDSNPHGFPHDFESCASANSATSAYFGKLP